MTFEEAKVRLSGYDIIDKDNVSNLSPYVGYSRDWAHRSDDGAETICLDGDFTADELEAFLAIMRPEAR